jgi:hypothetical protein
MDSQLRDFPRAALVRMAPFVTLMMKLGDFHISFKLQVCFRKN